MEKLTYDNVGPFSEGLARAHNNEEWFHILTDGTPAYSTRYDHVGSFSVGLARARNNDRSFQIYPNGTEYKI